MDPLFTVTLGAVGLYVLIVSFLPKSMVFETSKYTRNQLQRLEQGSAGLQQEVEVGLLKDRFLSTGLLARAFYMLPFAKASQPHIVRAGYAASVDKLFIGSLAAFFIGMLLFKGQGILAIPFALGFAYVVAWRLIARGIKKRTNKFLDQFPDALDMIVRSVRSGFPMNAAVNMVAENMQAPIAEEFKQVSEEVSHGSTMVEALARLSARLQQPDVNFFSIVLTLQQEVGGNLAEVLHNLADVIRKRKHLRMKIKTLTSEGKATMWVLGGLPVFVAGVISVVTPDHFKPFYELQSGHIVFGGAIGLVVLGVAIVRKMTNMEV